KVAMWPRAPGARSWPSQSMSGSGPRCHGAGLTITRSPAHGVEIRVRTSVTRRRTILYHRQVLDPDHTSELVASAAGGDREAWDRLVDEFSGLVWSVIRGCGLYGADASDVSQTVWLRFVEHIDRLRQAERAGAWLATTARHECFRMLRRQGRQLATGDVPEVASPDETEHYVDALAAAEDRGAAVAAMEQLPNRGQQRPRLMTLG